MVAITDVGKTVSDKKVCQAAAFSGSASDKLAALGLLGKQVQTVWLQLQLECKR